MRQREEADLDENLTNQAEESEQSGRTSENYVEEYEVKARSPDHEFLKKFKDTGKIPEEVLKDYMRYQETIKDEYVDLVRRFRDGDLTTGLKDITKWNPPGPTPKYYKEFNFILAVNIDRKLVFDLDFEARQKLEEVIPSLVHFNMLVFKNNGNYTKHKAFIFPARGNYHLFIETMKEALGRYHQKYHDVMKSKLLLNFRGKYIFEFD